MLHLVPFSLHCLHLPVKGSLAVPISSRNLFLSLFCNTLQRELSRQDIAKMTTAKSPTAPTDADSEQEFVHHLAIEMSRLTNSINPNDLLARHLIDIAKGNRTGDAFVKAVSTFGKFPEDRMLSIHNRILAHISLNLSNRNGHTRRGSDHSPPRMAGVNGAGGNGDSKMEGMDHDSSDTLAAEPKRKGGLMRPGGDVGGSSSGSKFTEVLLRHIPFEYHKVLDRPFWASISWPWKSERQLHQLLPAQNRPTSGSSWKLRTKKTGMLLPEGCSKVGSHSEI